MTATPDLSGFREAMERGRDALGQDVVFHASVAPVWPDGTAVDRETGRPYDPTIVPSSGGGEDDFTLHVGVITWVGRSVASDEVQATERGIERTGKVALDVALTDYERAQAASAFTLDGIRYAITDIVLSGLGGVDRLLVYGEAQ